MGEINVTIPEDVYSFIILHQEIHWNEIASRSIEDYAKKLMIMDILASNSSLEESLIDDLDHQIKESLHEQYKNHLKI